jgi:hypothetical protein
VRSLRVDRVYTFREDGPWSQETVRLDHLLTAGTMLRLFRGLPSPVQADIERLAATCRGSGWALLLPPAEHVPGEWRERLRTGLAQFARDVQSREPADYVLVKPHPLNSDAYVAELESVVRGALPGPSVHVMREHRRLPIEVVFAPFTLRACAAVGSSSLWTLGRVFGVRAYCAEALLRRLYDWDPLRQRAVTAWIEHTRDAYTAL